MNKLTYLLKNIIHKIDQAVNVEEITNPEIDYLFGTASGTGTNAQDGTNYIKYASGRLVCWGSVFGSDSGFYIPSGSQYADTTITFPISFVDTNYILQFGGFTGTTAIGNVGVPVRSGWGTTTNCPIRVWRNVNETTWNSTCSFYWLAIGQWK